MQKKQFNKALIVCLFFLLAFSLVPSNWHKVGDFQFHFEKASGQCESENCLSYYPLFHWLASTFAFNERAFIHFFLFLIVFVTPILLFLLTKHWMVTWLYFSVTQYVYTIVNGAYPQALAMVFLILLIYTKNPYARMGVLIIGLLAHSQSFILLLLVWFIITLFENLPKLKNFFPACSALFGIQETDLIGQKISIQIIDVTGTVRASNFLIKDILNFFVRVFPLPFLLMAFWQVKKEKDWALFAIVGLVFYYGIVAVQPRLFFVIPILLLPALTRFYLGLNGWWKRGFIGLTFVTFIINAGTWVLFKVNCV